MKLVEKIYEPNRLYLVWQTSNLTNSGSGGTGDRYPVAELVRLGDEFRFSYFSESSSFQNAKKIGFNGYPAFDLAQNSFQSPLVLSAFNPRIFKKSRTDYNQFLNYYGIASGVKISDFALLGYSRGTLPSDGFSFEIDFTNAEFPLEIPTPITGVRHYLKPEDEFAQEIYVKNNNSLSSEFYDGLRLEIIAEPENPQDSNAHRVELVEPQHKLLGYINRIHAEQITRFAPQHKISGEIMRINGKIESPQILLKLRID